MRNARPVVAIASSFEDLALLVQHAIAAEVIPVCPPLSMKWIDIMEEWGEIEADEARRWKEGIYGLMVLWGLEPDEVLAAGL